MLVRDIMTNELASLPENATAQQAAHIMAQANIGAVPIKGKRSNQLCGILTDRDIVLRCISQGKDPKTCVVKEICTQEVHHIHPDKTIDEALQIMGRKQIKRLIVTRDENPIGILSLCDIARVRSSTDTARALSGMSMP